MGDPFIDSKDRKNLLAFWHWAQCIHDEQVNPVAKTYKLPHGRKEQYIPMQSHIQQILMVASKRERVFLQCSLQTAARKTEVFKWKWGEDVDFRSRQVRLSTQKTRDGSVEYVWLPMSERLSKDLSWWYKNRKHRESENVWTIPEGPFEGQPYTFRHRFL